MIELFNKKHLWQLQFVGFGIVITLCNKKAKLYGIQQGWHFDCILRKNSCL
jgi:hypothetical protein